MRVTRARPWISHEDIVLQRLAAAGKYAATIAAEMARSEAIRKSCRPSEPHTGLGATRAQGEGEGLTCPTIQQIVGGGRCSPNAN
jgi:hypothetical protein